MDWHIGTNRRERGRPVRNAGQRPALPANALPNIHLKTIIVDEDTMAEGSFNWLSATRDAESDYHNHEQTLYIQRSKVQKLIEHFFQSRVGSAALTTMCKQMAGAGSSSNPLRFPAFSFGVGQSPAKRDEKADKNKELRERRLSANSGHNFLNSAAVANALKEKEKAKSKQLGAGAAPLNYERINIHRSCRFASS